VAYSSGLAQLRFDGQVAVVTGVGSGLGHGYALELARRGATVVGSVRPGGENGPGADELRRVARSEGLDLELVAADSASEEQATRLVTGAVDRHGRIDVLINNAGYNVPGAIHDGTTEQLRAMLDVALMGTFWTMVPALANMRARGSGRIVNTVSGAGMFPASGAFAYSACKGAIQAMSRSAALDNADLDVGINMISPIAVTTLSPDYRGIHPDLDADRMSVARVLPAVVYLCHPSCKLRGQTLHAAAGRVAIAGTFVARGWGSDTLTAEDIGGHINEICDESEIFVLHDRLAQYELIPKRAEDFARWG